MPVIVSGGSTDVIVVAELACSVPDGRLAALTTVARLPVERDARQRDACRIDHRDARRIADREDARDRLGRRARCVVPFAPVSPVQCVSPTCATSGGPPTISSTGPIVAAAGMAGPQLGDVRARSASCTLTPAGSGGGGRRPACLAAEERPAT